VSHFYLDTDVSRILDAFYLEMHIYLNKVEIITFRRRKYIIASVTLAYVVMSVWFYHFFTMSSIFAKILYF
jgi:hypothetical protein